MILLGQFNGNLFAAETYTTNIKLYQGLAADTKSTASDVTIGSIWHETDTGRTYRYNGSGWVIQLESAYAVGDTIVMFAPGNTDAIFSRGYNLGGYIIDINSVNTSVTGILQGKVGDQPWGAIVADSTIYTTDSNGVDGVLSGDIAVYDSLRWRWESEAGGTAAEVVTMSTLSKE